MDTRPGLLHPGGSMGGRSSRRSSNRRLAALVVSLMLATLAPAASGSTWVPQRPGAPTESSNTLGAWSTLGEYRVSPRPTSLSTAAASPSSPPTRSTPRGSPPSTRSGPGEQSHPVIRISHDGGTHVDDGAGRPRGGGSHPMVAWVRAHVPGPRACTTPRWSGPGRPPLRREHSDDEGRTWHLGFIADQTRGWSIGIEDIVVDTNPDSPSYGALYLAYNWPKDPLRRARACTSSRRALRADVARSRSRSSPGPTATADAWRIATSSATAPDGSAYVAGYQLDMKTWRHRVPVLQGRHSTSGGSRSAWPVCASSTRPPADHGPNILATRLPETAWNLGWTPALKGVNVGLAEPVWATGSSSTRAAASTTRGRATNASASSPATTRAGPGAPLPAPGPRGGRAAQLLHATRPGRGNGFVAVLFHTGRRVRRQLGSAGNAVAVSFDRGASWVGPRPVQPHPLAHQPDHRRLQRPGPPRPGRRSSRIAGRLFGYGDGREAAAAFGARIRVTVAPKPTPTPTPTPRPRHRPRPQPAPAP